MDVDDDIREFLIESNENLAQLDREIVELEKFPSDMKLISSVFRCIHTIKGTCGFFGFDILGSVAHITENILSQVREQKRNLTPALISLILESADIIKSLLNSIESTGAEGDVNAAPLLVRLEHAHQQADDISSTPEAEAEAEMETEGEADPEPEQEEPAGEELPEAPAPIAASVLLPDHVAAASAPEPVHARPGTELMAPAPVAPAEVLAADMPPEDKVNEGAKDSHLVDSTIRVDVKLLNKLMNLVGELVLARNQLLQDTSAQNSSLQQTSQRLNLITSELQEGVMKTRMQPIGVVWNKLPRVVRDLAAKCGKEVKIEMDGAGTELDKTIIEAIKDPLTHIVRNSCDHGIESPEVRITKNKSPEGLLVLRAFHEGGVVNIEISDDGAGIDVERVKAKAVEKKLITSEQSAQMTVRDAIQLIFMPGFSTAAKVTSISGRGVGMDVVKTNIEKIGGNVQVFNRPEAGTTIRIKIPLTLAIIPGLVVTLDPVPDTEDRRCRKEERFVIPQANLLELVRLEGVDDLKRIENVHGTPVFHHRGKLLPLAYLNKVLGRTKEPAVREVINIIVIQAENRQMGLVVDHICDTQEIVVKPLGRQLKGLTCYVGATIMGDGRPALILDVAGLSRLAGLGGQIRQPSSATPTQAQTDASQPHMLLLFRAGKFERLAVPLSMVTRLEEIPLEKIERAAGKLVLHYRDNILPLICLTQALDSSCPEMKTTGGMVQIIVFTDGHRRIGVIVDQILDIVKEAVTVKRSSPVRGLLGSAVVGGKITDLIDLHALVVAAGENWLDQSPNLLDERTRILLVDPSIAAREMVQEFLEFAGYEIIPTPTVQDALLIAKRTPLNLIVIAAHMQGDGADVLLKAVRQDSGLRNIPVLGLFDREDQVSQQAVHGIFDGHLVRGEREQMIEMISTLIRKIPALQEAS